MHSLPVWIVLLALPLSRQATTDSTATGITSPDCRCGPRTTQPQPPFPIARLSVEPVDTPVKIEGWFGKDRSLARTIRLTASGASVRQLVVIPSDVICTDPAARHDRPLARPVATDPRSRSVDTLVIPHDSVAVIVSGTFQPGEPHAVTIRIGGFTEPLTCAGTLDLRVQGHQPSLVIPFEVRAHPQPTLRWLSTGDHIRAQLIRPISCPIVGSLDTWLTSLLFRDAAQEDTQSLAFENPTRAPIDIPYRDARLAREDGYGSAPIRLVELPWDHTRVADSPFVHLPLRFSATGIASGRYAGTITLTVTRQEPIALPIDVSVRDGPLVPALALMFRDPLRPAPQAHAGQ